MSPHETFEHTADVGLRVRSGDLNGLFAEAGRGFTSLLFEDFAGIGSDREIQIELHADKLDDLLLDWLSELLVRFDTEHVLFTDYRVQIKGHHLHARCRGEKVDPARHRLDHEIKAVTYHGLRVERQADGWLAEVIFDI